MRIGISRFTKILARIDEQYIVFMLSIFLQHL